MLRGKLISVSFDGTTNTAETLAIVFRFVSEDLQPITLCVRLMLLERALRGTEIANCLHRVLQEYGVDFQLVTAFAHDRASSNGAAMTLLLPFCPNSLDMPCLAHFFDNLGKQLKQDAVDRFVSKLTNLFSRSAKARAFARRAPFSLPVKAINDTRW